MSKRGELNSYIGRLQQRLRLGALLRGIAVLFMILLIVLVGWPASMFMWYAAHPRLPLPANSALLGAP